MSVGVVYTGSPTRRPVVLLVDSAHLRRDTTLRQLTAHGFSPIRAIDSLDALRVAREWKPRVVVTGIALSGPLSGCSLAHQLRNDCLLRDVRIIATGEDNASDRATALRVGCDAFLARSSPPERLMKEIQRLLTSPERSPSGLKIGMLYWTRLGEVACERHRPDSSSERWTQEVWTPIPYQMKRYRRYQCQHCDGTPLRHLGARRFPDGRR